ncbi:uncharacterized protein DMENIID0001_151360 [Sergentomyia squamirostris]
MSGKFVLCILVVFFPNFLAVSEGGEFLGPGIIINSPKSHNISCEQAMHRVANAAKDFTLKIIQHSAPVTYCNHSVEQYVIFEESYRNLTTLTQHDTSKNTTIVCKDIYFNVDRLGVLETMYNQLHQMWMTGFCDDCFANTSAAIISNTTQDFYDYWDSMNECLVNNHDDPCLKCMSHYQKFNDFYDGIKKEKGDRICFDLQDAMNRTRIRWSGELNCCRDRKSSMVLFYVISSIVATLPVLFYVAFFFHTRHQERFDIITIDDEPSTSHNNSSSSNSETLNHTESQPGPSRSAHTVEANEDVGKKLSKRGGSDESDDENLLR